MFLLGSSGLGGVGYEVQGFGFGDLGYSVGYWEVCVWVFYSQMLSVQVVQMGLYSCCFKGYKSRVIKFCWVIIEQILQENYNVFVG